MKGKRYMLSAFKNFGVTFLISIAIFGVIAYFATESGEKISFDVPLAANSREDAPEKRAFHEKFTLKSREYKYGDKYYLHLVDSNDEKNILHSYEFMIDIAFVDDFGF